MTESLGHKAASGAVWASIDRFGIMVLQFVVNLVLARILMPQDFGAVGMLAIFMVVSQVLIDGGFGSALIQKKNPTQIDYSTIFFWNLFFSTFLYFVLFICSPAIGRFYSMPGLEDVLKVMGLSLIVFSVYGIQKNRLQKLLKFKVIAITELSSWILGAIVSILLAYKGFGVWSLVSLQLVTGLALVFGFWLTSKWVPSLRFSNDSLRELFSYGGYILAAGLLQEFCKNIQGLIIGKRFSAVQMGYYSQAYKLDQVGSYSIPQVIVQVMFPVYSSIQEDRNKLIDILSMNLRVIAFLIFPMVSILIIIGEPMIEWLYGDKWLPCVPYFKILCVGGFFVCLQNINFYAVAALGKSKVLFYWSFYKWGFLLLALFGGMFFGMYGILWAMVLSNLNIYLINAFLTSKYVGLGLLNQFICLSPMFLTSAFSISISFLLFQNNSLLCLISFVLLYLGLSTFLKFRALNDTFQVLNKIIHR